MILINDTSSNTKVNIISIYIETFNENILLESFKDIPKNSKINILLDSNLFLFTNISNLDEIKYNVYDYIILKVQNYCFAFNRDSLISIINLCKKNSLTVNSISPDFRNFQGEKTLFENKINFLTSEYRKLHQENEKIKVTFLNKSYFILILAIISIIFFMFIYNNSKKIDLINKKISIKKLAIQKYEKELITLKNIKNNKDTYEKHLKNSSPEILTILNKINKHSNKNIFYKKIDISKNKIKILGDTISLKDLYSFEGNLIKSGFSNINNDFIKNKNSNYFEFSLDCDVEE